MQKYADEKDPKLTIEEVKKILELTQPVVQSTAIMTESQQRQQVMWIMAERRYTLVLTKPHNLVYYGDLTIELFLQVDGVTDFDFAQYSKSSQNLYLMDQRQRSIYRFKLDIVKLVKNQQREEFKNILKSVST